MVEINAHLRELTGDEHNNRSRRLRELYPYFVITKVGTGQRSPGYRLDSRKAEKAAGPTTISLRVRAQVLAPQICARCGASPLKDAVKLVVDHKLPQKWGGTHDIENLQPLCEDCNSGKKDYFKAFDQYSDKIRQAAHYAEPQRRIGELLLAFGTDEWVPGELLEVVASAKEYQRDWERRLRDLRFLGWDYKYRNRKNNGRVHTSYRLTRSADWPQDIRAALKQEEAHRKAAKRGILPGQA